MSSSADLLKAAEASVAENPQHAIQLYKQILTNTAGNFHVQ